MKAVLLLLVALGALLALACGGAGVSEPASTRPPPAAPTTAANPIPTPISTPTLTPPLTPAPVPQAACPAGYYPVSETTCCPDGYYPVGDGSCCPQGTSYDPARGGCVTLTAQEPPAGPSSTCLNIVQISDPQLGCIDTPPFYSIGILLGCDQRGDCVWQCQRDEVSLVGWSCTASMEGAFCPVKLATHPECVPSQHGWNCIGVGSEEEDYSCVLTEGVMCYTLLSEYQCRQLAGLITCRKAPFDWTCTGFMDVECSLPNEILPSSLCWPNG